ncbi:MAG: hypothetical protein JSV96_19160 [Candidatus Aminicenantes bacterium]|nr:MAG: hypothetical protein JSV96_19160 [Candidatus Aminicenantes bacterium]
MRKTTSFMTLFVFLLVFSSGISFSQEVDISGTWKGETEVPDAPEPDKLTLVIEKIEGGYTGTITDSMGMLQEEKCEDIELKDNTLTLNFNVFTGEEYMRDYVTMTVKGDKMSGYWESEDGGSGEVELERSK